MMIPKLLPVRSLYYLLLAVLCVVIPYLVTIILIMATGDRVMGVTLSVIPSILIVHLIFSLAFLRTRLWIKLVMPLVTTIIGIIGLKFLLPLNIMETNFDIYGYWDIVLTHSMLSIFTWEIIYHLLKAVVKPVKMSK